MTPQEIANNWIAENGEIRPLLTYATNKIHIYPCPTLADGEYRGGDLDFEWIEEMPEDSQLIICLKQPPAIDAGERANTQQSVEEAAIKFSSDYYDEHQKVGFGTDYLNGLEVGANNGFIAGHALALASSNMVELDRVLGIIDKMPVPNGLPRLAFGGFQIAKQIAITQIKNLTKQQ